MENNLAPTHPDYKQKIRTWLRHQVGERVGPNGLIVPFPDVIETPAPLCSDCNDLAHNTLRGWLSDGSRVEVPLCQKHAAAAEEFISKRKKALRDRDAARRRANTDQN